MTSSPNANLTDETRELNRLKWLLVEAAAKAKIPVNQAGINAMAINIQTLMHEHNLIMTWLSEFEADING